MTITPILLAQASGTAIVGWLLVKWMTARGVARGITSVVIFNSMSLMLTLVLQFISTSGCHCPSPPVPFSRTRSGLNLSIQRPDGVVLCWFLSYVSFLATSSRASLISEIVYKKYRSTSLASTTFWDAQPMYWVADADAVKTITSDRTTFGKDLEAVRAPLIHYNYRHRTDIHSTNRCVFTARI